MKEAEGDLSGERAAKPAARTGRAAMARAGKTGKGAAVDAQGRALEALRDGAQGLEKQMQAQAGPGTQRQGQFCRRAAAGRASVPGDDPLGRGAEGDKGREDGPLKETAGAAERARRVMEEFRRRLADPAPARRRARLPRTADEAGLSAGGSSDPAASDQPGRKVRRPDARDVAGRRLTSYANKHLV